MLISVLIFPLLIFSLAYILTLKWYVQVGSTSALCFGAIAQPLLTAIIFALELMILYSSLQWGRTPNFEGFFTAVLFYTFTISVPIALVFCLAGAIFVGSNQMTHDRSSREHQLSDFTLLIVAGGVSVVCASIATCVYIFVGTW
jgi:hypothetical protein